MTKLDWSWPQVVVFGLVLLTCGTLVLLGKVGPELMATPLALLVPAGPQPRPGSTSPSPVTPTGGAS